MDYNSTISIDWLCYFYGSLIMDMHKNNIAILGLGKSGLAVAEYLHNTNQKFDVYDENLGPDISDALATIDPQAPLIQTSFNKTANIKYDRVFISPGISPSLKFVQSIQTNEGSLTNDIELFINRAKKPIIAITGSNGKSTTCKLLQHVLEKNKYHVLCGGNIGTSALTLLKLPEPDYYLLELSSFQLEIAKNYNIECGVILNVTEDHLDRHGNFEAYLHCKLKLASHSKKLVVNQKDKNLCGIKHKNITYFNTDSSTEQTQNSKINPNNISAIKAIIQSLELPISENNLYLNEFKGLVYRHQFVSRINKIDFINDSKSTNPGCIIEALKYKNQPNILILGGQTKNVDLKVLVPWLKTKVIFSVAFGESKMQYQQLCIDHCIPIKIAENLEQAVAIAYKYAVSNDTILLSPGGASFDLYPGGYKQRGEHFNSLVYSLI